MAVNIVVPAAHDPLERRVALTPETAKKFLDRGATITLQAGAGEQAGFPDTHYADVTISNDINAAAAQADLVLCVEPPKPDLIAQLSATATLVGLLAPHQNTALIQSLRTASVKALAVELIPRITRAQSMDVLSSQANIAGYKAALIGANTLGSFLPMLTTAAGTIRPANALVIGAGVAGLQAIATLRRLGARVSGYDVRPETAGQVQSLGAKFIEIAVDARGDGGYARELSATEKAAQQAALAKALTGFDLIITTAAIPGRPAPQIITAAMVEALQPGTVIVDIAAADGGNCALSQAGQTVVHQGVTIVGPVNLAAQLPVDASNMYARNLWHLLSPFIADGEFRPDYDDEILIACLCTADAAIKGEQ